MRRPAWSSISARSVATVETREAVAIPGRVARVALCGLLVAASAAMPGWARGGPTSRAGAQATAAEPGPVPANGDGIVRLRLPGDYVARFAAGGYRVAGAEYAIVVQLLGARHAQPLVEIERSQETSTGALGARYREQVRYPQPWTGIDIVFDAPGGGNLRSTFEVAPGADPAAIRWRYDRPVSLEPDGRLRLAASVRGALHESPPIAWQEVAGERRPIEVAFEVDPRGSAVGFRLGTYDPRLSLVIDPTLVWNTFLGGTGSDSARSVALDAADNAHVVGSSPESWDSPLVAHAGGSDVYLAKLDPSGGLLWHTFLGSTDFDQGLGVAVDGAGNVYVAGSSGSSWGSPVRAHGGGVGDGLVAKLDASGALLWLTFLGGGGDDVASKVAVDGAGNVFVLGRSFSAWGTDPVTDHAGASDLFVARLDGDGALVWHTFLGSSTEDFLGGFTADAAGNSYATGRSTNTWGAPVRAHTIANGSDAFAARLDADGALVWNTFLGAIGVDEGESVALDGAGGVFASGNSINSWETPVNAHSGSNSDAFVARLIEATGVLDWNTFLGGAGFDEAIGVAADSSGDAVLVGYSSATWGSPVLPHSGTGNDALAARLDSGGALVLHTFLGGDGADLAWSVAVGASDDVVLVGDTLAAWGSPLRDYTANADGFVARLAPFEPGTTLFSLLNPSTYGQDVTFVASVVGIAPTGTVDFVVDAVAIPGCESVALVDGAASCSTSTLTADLHTVTAEYGGDVDNAPSSDTVDQLVQPATTVTALSSSETPAAPGATVTFTAGVTAEHGTEPTGTVAFLAGIDPIPGCEAVPLLAGSAACATASLPPGNHTITAEYGGDANHETSADALEQQVLSPVSPFAVPTLSAAVLVALAALLAGTALFTLRTRNLA